MKQGTKVHLLLANVVHDIDTTFTNAHKDLTAMFTSTNRGNEGVSHEASAHEAMLEYVLHKLISGIYGKKTDEAKKRLDLCASGMDIDPDGVEGQTTLIYESNVFSFTKRRNKNTKVVATKDLITHLSRLGVEKSVMDKAIGLAEKDKHGNTYYDVNVLAG